MFTNQNTTDRNTWNHLETCVWCKTASEDEALILEFGGEEYPYITTTFWFTLTQRVNTYWGPIYGSNRIGESFTRNYY